MLLVKLCYQVKIHLDSTKEFVFMYGCFHTTVKCVAKFVIDKVNEKQIKNAA